MANGRYTPCPAPVFKPLLDNQLLPRPEEELEAIGSYLLPSLLRGHQRIGYSLSTGKYLGIDPIELLTTLNINIASQRCQNPTGVQNLGILGQILNPHPLNYDTRIIGSIHPGCFSNFVCRNTGYLLHLLRRILCHPFLQLIKPVAPLLHELLVI